MRDVFAAAWMENGDTVTALLKQKGIPLPLRSKDSAFRIGYCKPERDPIDIGLRAASLGINPHCILTDQRRLVRSARKRDTVVCLAGDGLSKASQRYLVSEGVTLKSSSGLESAADIFSRVF